MPQCEPITTAGKRIVCPSKPSGSGFIRHSPIECDRVSDLAGTQQSRTVKFEIQEILFSISQVGKNISDYWPMLTEM